MATVITNSTITVDGNSFLTADSDTIAFDNANNRVGIGGALAPSVPLEVNGNINATNNTHSVLISGDDGSIEIQRTGSPYIDFKTTAGEDYDVRLQQIDNGFTISTGGNGAAAERMRIANDGNVGINTTSPDTILEIVDRAPVLQIRDTNTGISDNLATLRLAETGADDTTDNYYDLALENGDFIINYGTSNRIKIDRTTGYVGINHTEPEAFLHVDDKDGTGPTVIFEGGGTNQNTPADGEQTLFLKTGDGTGDLSTGIGFFATFENTPGDTNDRRATDIRAGFDGGSWGTEYMSFHIGKGTGSTNNDAGAMTDERLKITKTAVTATVPINDDKGDVRQAPVSSQTATFTVPSGSSGEMFRIAGSVTNININVANFAEGDIVTLVNVSGTNTPTLTFDAWSNGVRIAGGDGTNLASTSTTTLDVWGVVTLIAIASTRLTINGNVS